MLHKSVEVYAYLYNDADTSIMANTVTQLPFPLKEKRKNFCNKILFGLVMITSLVDEIEAIFHSHN